MWLITNSGTEGGTAGQIVCMASAPAAWRLKSERQRWLIGFVQVALTNAYALYRNNAILAGVAPDNILNNQFAVQVGEGVYRGDCSELMPNTHAQSR